MLALIFGSLVGISLFLVSKRRRYKTWESVLWLVIGMLFNLFAIPLFGIRLIAQKKGWGLSLGSGSLVLIGLALIAYDISRAVAFSLFSSPQLSASSIVGVFLVGTGLAIALLAGRKTNSLAEQLFEIEQLAARGAISKEEHSALRKNILGSPDVKMRPNSTPEQG